MGLPKRHRGVLFSGSIGHLICDQVVIAVLEGARALFRLEKSTHTEKCAQKTVNVCCVTFPKKHGPSG